MIFCAAQFVWAVDESGFGVRAQIQTAGDNSLAVSVTLVAPGDGVIPFESLALEADDLEVPYAITLVESTPATSSEEYPEGVLHDGATLRYIVTPAKPAPALYFTLQGCTASICYLPQRIRLDGEAVAKASTAQDTGMEKLTVVRSWSGYADAEQFLAWLKSDSAEENNLLQRVFDRHGAVLALLLTMLLGIMLNFTPCVLPMIPITLGIIGVRGVSRRRGVILGACYGGAIALTYGVLGIVFLVIGGQFSAVSGSGWFNLLIALIFVVLAGAMADFYSLDFSRFRRIPGEQQRNSVFGAFMLGLMTALMAGACVAPVLLWVLLLAADLRNQGSAVAWLLPLALGAGFGALWPLLGSGVGFLPRPGKWMIHIKRLVAVMILLFGLYYMFIAVTIFRGSSNSRESNAIWQNDIAASLADARESGRPLLVDFWGVACKSCVAMDVTTLRNESVRDAMQQYICVKIQGDNNDNAEAQSLMRHCGVIGFPTYVILQYQSVEN